MALCVAVSTNITTTGATFYVCVQVHNLYNFSFSCYMKFSHKSSLKKKSYSLCSYGEANRGAEAAARKAMSDQQGAAEAK